MASDAGPQLKDLGLCVGEDQGGDSPEGLYMEGQDRADSGDKSMVSDLLARTISCLLEGLTVQQRRGLESGSPSVATKLLLAETLLDVVRLVSNHLLESFNGAPVTCPDQEVETCLWRVLSPVMGAVVDGDDGTSCCRSLAALLLKEIKKNTSCFSPAGDHVAIVALNQCNTRCETVDVLVDQVTSVLAQRLRRATVVPLVGQRKNKRVSFTVSEDVGSSMVAPAEELKEEPASIRKILMTEVEQLVHPLLADEEFRQLMSRTRPEASLMCGQVSLSETLRVSSAGPGSFPGAREQMKTFFTVCFYRAWILHVLLQLRKTFDLQKTPVRSLQALLDEVDCLLAKEDRTSVSFLLVLSGRLSDLIHSHVSCRRSPRSGLYADIQYRVQVFMLLAKWWWKTQAEVQVEQVCRSLSDVQLTVLIPSLDRGEAAVLGGGRSKAVVDVLTEKLLSHVLTKVKYQERTDDLRPVARDIFQAVWAELKSAQVDLPPVLLPDFQGAKKVLHVLLQGTDTGVQDQQLPGTHKDKLLSLKNITKLFRQKSAWSYSSR